MRGDGINHGTYGGYQKHRKLGVEACAECLAAQVWYARRRRESAEVRAEEKRQDSAAKGQVIVHVYGEVDPRRRREDIHGHNNT